MNPETGNRFTEEGEDSLFRHLEPDTPEIMEIKSLQGEEYEYSDYLGTIEYSIARRFYEDDRKIKDKDAVVSIEEYQKKLRQKYLFF